jgi:hypothetical protein
MMTAHGSGDEQVLWMYEIAGVDCGNTPGQENTL